MIRLALSDQDAKEFRHHFLAAAPFETGAFFLLRHGVHASGTRLVASQPYFPGISEWDHAGEHQLRPSARLLSAMVSRAQSERSGLLFVHSHPNPDHPPGFSPSDRMALHSLAQVMPKLLDGPFAAAVASRTGWAGEWYEDGQWYAIDRVTAAGRGFRILSFSVDTKERDPGDDRQERALGPLHDHLRTLHVGVVGCGGLGSPLAETLVRMGVRKLVLIDYGGVDTPSNLRRIFGSRLLDLRKRRPKATVVGDHCRSLGLDTEIVDAAGDVRDRRVFSHLLDLDIVFCATDSHSSRAVLDAAAYAFHLQLVDCGVRVGLRQKAILAGLLSEVRVLGPGLPCLWCRRTLSAEVIRNENLPAAERSKLWREGYVVGNESEEPSVAALTVLGAGMMSCVLLGLLSEDSDVLPGGIMFDGFMGDAPSVPTHDDASSCICQRRLGRAYEVDLGLYSDGTL